jgi:hypothetical protein
MYYRDHNPPHFHAIYSEFEGILDIENNELIGGYLPPRVLGLVNEWTAMHQDELIVNWQRARDLESLDQIEPLV